MEEYPTQEDQVLLLQERVSEAQRLAAMVMREKDAARKGKRKGRGDDEETAAGLGMKLGGGKRRK